MQKKFYFILITGYFSWLSHAQENKLFSYINLHENELLTQGHRNRAWFVSTSNADTSSSEQEDSNFINEHVVYIGGNESENVMCIPLNDLYYYGLKINYSMHAGYLNQGFSIELSVGPFHNQYFIYGSPKGTIMDIYKNFRVPVLGQNSESTGIQFITINTVSTNLRHLNSLEHKTLVQLQQVPPERGEVDEQKKFKPTSIWMVLARKDTPIFKEAVQPDVLRVPTERELIALLEPIKKAKTLEDYMVAEASKKPFLAPGLLPLKNNVDDVYSQRLEQAQYALSVMAASNDHYSSTHLKIYELTITVLELYLEGIDSDTETGQTLTIEIKKHLTDVSNKKERTMKILQRSTGGVSQNQIPTLGAPLLDE